MKNTFEEVTITKVVGNNVSYNSTLWSGCHLSNFPDTPKVGDVYVIESNFSKIIKITKKE